MHPSLLRADYVRCVQVWVGRSVRSWTPNATYVNISPELAVGSSKARPVQAHAAPACYSSVTVRHAVVHVWFRVQVRCSLINSVLFDPLSTRTGGLCSCLPLSTCVALMDFMLCEQEASPLPAFIDGLYHSLQALYPAVVIMSPPARQAPKYMPVVLTPQTSP